MAEGVNIIDSSVAGIGGCPYAGGKFSGNIPTEDVLYMLKLLGLETSAKPDQIIRAGEYAAHILCKQNFSRVNKEDFKIQNLE